MLTWKGEQRFEARSEGTTILVDGTGSEGPAPVRLLLQSIGACTGVDVVDILHKGRQNVDELVVEVEAERRSEHPRRVRTLLMRFRLRGDVDRKKAERAVDLSLEKYCSVFHSLRMDISPEVEIIIES
jgi:putative redox protein